MRRKIALSALVLLCLPAGCDSPDLDRDEFEELAEDAELRVQWDAVFTHFDLAQDSSLAARATGAVLDSIRDSKGNAVFTPRGDPFRTTCGITFISPRYAVTAGHCVDQSQETPPQATVEQYDITSLSLGEVEAGSIVEGVFPNIQRLDPIDDLPEYEVETYECEVVRRCAKGSSDHDPYNCELNADIALVYCPDRPDTGAWMPVASSDSGEGPVEMYWAHEVLNIPSKRPESDASAINRYDHYTTKLSALPQTANHHYIGGDANALLPLKSVDWPAAMGGMPRQRFGTATSSTVPTDLFICHGSSGSGALKNTKEEGYELLGPLVYGHPSWNGRLCVDPSVTSPGNATSYYVSNALTRSLVASSWLQIFKDRNSTSAPDWPSQGG